MSGGGQVSQPVQDNSLQLRMLEERYRREADQRAEREERQEGREFDRNLAQAVTTGRNTGEGYLASRGLSEGDFGSVLDQIIQDQRALVPKLDSNPNAYFTSDVFATGLDRHQAALRANNTSAVNSNFAPGFESNYLPSNSIDDIVNEILGTQRGTASQQIDFQRARGLLNDSGFNTAQQRLGEQEQAARGTLNSLGTAELAKDRSGLTNIIANAGNAASSWTLGTPKFTLDPYKTQVQDFATRELSTLGGDIRGALGGTQLFDIPSIIAAAGTAQGPQNLTTVDALPGVPFNQRRNNRNRGLGSTGAF